MGVFNNTGWALTLCKEGSQICVIAIYSAVNSVTNRDFINYPSFSNLTEFINLSEEV